MRLFILIFVLTILGTVGNAQPAKHVVLIVVDGLRPTFYLHDSWPAPTLQALKERGAAVGGVNPVFPAITYPSHTSIVTGVSPAKHGVFYNARFEPEGPRGRWYWENQAIRSTTLWQAAKQAGLRTASLLWPVTVDAEIDYNIPPVWSPSSYDSRAITSQKATPEGLFEELQRHATGTLDSVAFSVQGSYLMRDQNIGRMAAYLLRTYRPALLTLNLPLLDKAQHAEGLDGLHVRKSIAGADHAIQTILDGIAAAGIADSTAVIVMGDHGFMDVHTQLNPNVWLRQHGLYDGPRGEWKARFHNASGSTFLMVKDSDPATADSIRSVLRRLPDAIRAQFEIVERTALDRLESSVEAILALSGQPGVVFSEKSDGPFYEPAPRKGSHGHLPSNPQMKSGLVAYGAGIREGVFLDEMDIRDVSALVAYLLGLGFPSGDGVLPISLLSGVR
ncbi:alkaline phosphatase family protein [Parapedobacter sp. ISTM3]|uniref:alkaline phosphatase family protein n=1 Tax=Parapedobacter sp. ISTM3 TaxID=2800130 RepID=UPI001908FEFE|nr:ectonucleotide pyrophosphatase/phosphodiesterase [Parapedobacter sp. ISTM3]MBK1438398.1 alkaline phosphatase family protein [Parapedobacter sp. ISTM3]